MTFRPRLILALGLVVLTACGPLAANGDGTLDLTVREVDLALPAAGPLEFAGAIELRAQDVRFGGLSGFVLDQDGEGFVAVSDAGYWAVGRLARTNGRLTGARITRYERFRAADGGVMPRALRDAEAIARHPDGGYLVSFERDHRVSRFADVGAPEGEVFRANNWRVMSINAGIESLVAAPGGPVYAIKEGRLPDRNGSPVWIVGQPDRLAARLPLRGHDYLTAADFGPDGRLYVLERRFSLFGGFTINIQRYPRMPASEADQLSPELLLTLTAAEGADNMEGLEVWRDAGGRTRLTLISDDNFNPLQRTLAMEFILRE
jgi:hypothetical protein